MSSPFPALLAYATRNEEMATKLGINELTHPKDNEMKEYKRRTPRVSSGDGIMWGAVAVWLIAFLVGIGVNVAIIWAIVKLVLHFT